MATSLVDITGGESKQPLTIIVKMHSTQDELRHNITTNIKRDLPRFMQLPGLLYARNEPIAVVGGGPSLNTCIDQIRKFNHVMVCGSAHDHLVSLGVTPTFALAVDAKEDSVNWFQNPQPKTSYLLASQCHPNMYEKLASHKVAMWHLKGQFDGEKEVLGDEPSINWGCMVGVMSIQMCLYLGFQELHFFGMDGNHEGDQHHAYDVGDYAQQSYENRTVFKCNGREFLSTTALISQMEHFFDIFSSSDGKFLKGYVYGDGLWANVIKASPPEMKEWLEAA